MDLARSVIDAVGESRSNADVFGELASRLGVLEDAARVQVASLANGVAN